MCCCRRAGSAACLVFAFLALLSQQRQEKAEVAVGTMRGSQLLSRWDSAWSGLPEFCPPECSGASCASVSLSTRSRVFTPHKPVGVSGWVCGVKRCWRLECWRWARCITPGDKPCPSALREWCGFSFSWCCALSWPHTTFRGHLSWLSFLWLSLGWVSLSPGCSRQQLLWMKVVVLEASGCSQGC